MPYEAFSVSKDTQMFAVYAEESLGSEKADRTERRRLEQARRKLLRSLVRVCNTPDDDEICQFAEYVLLITA